jgi:hypothetical protein
LGWAQEPPLVALARRSFSPAARRRESLFLPIQAGASLHEEDRSIAMEILYTKRDEKRA